MISEQQIKEIIVDQKLQMERKSRGISREVDYKNLTESPFISVITGIRRCGKSTLLLQLTKFFKNFYYINFDDERLFDFSIPDFQTMLLVFKQQYEAKTIFIDEIQNVPGWERFVRRIYDEGYKIFITGSNSKLLSSELATHLTGRYTKTELFPFSFTEYLRFHKIDFSKPGSDARARILSAFDNYLEDGGFPEYTRHGDKQQLQNIYEDIIYKDLIGRFGIKNRKALKQLAHYYYSNFTKEVSYNSLKNILGIKSITTIRDYSDYLQQAYLLFECYKFDYSLKKQLSYSKKVYAIDNGLRNSVSFRFNTDFGQLLENMVFVSLKKRNKEVWFYKTRKNREVDFCTQTGQGIQLYQVSYDISDKNTRQRELRSLGDAMSEIKTDNATILTYNQFDELEAGGRHIKILPVWYWMIETQEKVDAVS